MTTRPAGIKPHLEKPVEDPETKKKNLEANKVLYNKFVQDARDKKEKMEKEVEEKRAKEAENVATPIEEKKDEVIVVAVKDETPSAEPVKDLAPVEEKK